MTAVVRAELIKLRTTRLWWGMLLGAAALAGFNVLFTALTAANPPDTGGPVIPPLDEQAGVLATYGAGFQSAYLMLAVLGTLIAAGDFRHHTATPTFLATPHRGVVVAAKMAVAALVGVAYGVVLQAASVALGAAFIVGGGDSLRLAEPEVARALALGVLGIAVWAVIGTAVGILVRNQVVAVIGVVLAVFLVDVLVSLALTAVGAESAARFLPGNASIAVVEGSTGSELELLSWWAGLLTLLAYGAVTATIGYVVNLRRDVP